jgi:hypothetical protein
MAEFGAAVHTALPYLAASLANDDDTVGFVPAWTNAACCEAGAASHFRHVV